METKELNLYKVYAKGWNQPAYVAAENHQQAIEKVTPYYDTEPEHMNIEYVADIFV